MKTVRGFHCLLADPGLTTGTHAFPSADFNHPAVKAVGLIRLIVNLLSLLVGACVVDLHQLDVALHQLAMLFVPFVTLIVVDLVNASG